MWYSFVFFVWLVMQWSAISGMVLAVVWIMCVDWLFFAFFSHCMVGVNCLGMFMSFTFHHLMCLYCFICCRWTLAWCLMYIYVLVVCLIHLLCFSCLVVVFDWLLLSVASWWLFQVLFDAQLQTCIQHVCAIAAYTQNTYATRNSVLFSCILQPPDWISYVFVCLFRI